jgi:5-methylcytosine-specific restriction endonuclease McrA
MKRSPLRRVSLQTKTSTKVARKARRKRRATKAKLDQMARAYVMERDKYACQLKGLGGLTCTPQIQWCHIRSRRYLSTRWLPANAIAACAAHHRWSHDNPIDFAEFWTAAYPDRMEQVRIAFSQADAPTTLEVEEMLKSP